VKVREMGMEMGEGAIDHCPEILVVGNVPLTTGPAGAVPLPF
jgi:hypothetical protein